MQHNANQSFRENIRLQSGDGLSDVPVLEISQTGTSITLNSGAIPLTIGGVVAHSGGVKRVAALNASATQTLTAADSGSVIIASKTSATQTFTLPSAAVAGLNFTFVTVSAAGEVLINPITGQTIQLKATVDQGASVVTSAGAGCKNTAATNVVGDSIQLISDGVTGWVTINQSGIWATQ